MRPDVRLLLISGSTRRGSTNTAALRTAQVVTPHGVTARLFDGLADLPAFNPDDDDDPLPVPVADLREPVAWINVAAEGRGTNAHAALATVLGYVGAEIVEAACVRVPVPHQAVGPDGLVADEGLRTEIAQVLRTIASRAIT